MISRLAASYRAEQCTPICASVCACGEEEASDHNLRSALSHITRMAMGPANDRSSKVDLLAHSLNMYRRADAPSALDPLGRSLFADKKRQDKH